jgi:hypothetical protein
MKKTSLALLLALVSAAALAAPGAGAATFKGCGKFTPYGGGKANFQVKNVSCRTAKKVLQDASLTLCFDNVIPGWRKEWRALPNGGQALTLKKRAKAIKTNACSPR